jgi:hypothetical protein
LLRGVSSATPQLRGTFREILALPPPSCSVVRCNLVGTPRNIRHKFANAIIALSESTGRRFGGYVMRRVYEQVEVLIVVNPCSEEDLGDLYDVLRKFNADVSSFGFEATSYTEVNRLDRAFTVIRPGQEPENFSNEVELVNYEIASSIHSHHSSRI